MSVQIDAWIFALVGFAYVLSDRGTARSTLAAGALLGVAASLKLYPPLTIAIIAWLRRDNARWLLAGTAAAIVACLAIPLLLLGGGPMTQFIHVESGQSSPQVVGFGRAFGFLSIAVRALVRNPYVTSPGHFSPAVAQGIFVVFVLVVLGLVVSRFWRWRPAQGAAWSIALIATAVCSPYLEGQHLAPIALVLVLLADDYVASQRTGAPNSRLGQLLPVCCIPCIAGSLLATVLPIRGLEVASVMVIGATMTFLVTCRPKPTTAAVLFAAATIFLATWVFQSMTVFLGNHLSPLRVVLGSANLIGLISMLAAITLIAQVQSRAGTGRPPLRAVRM